MLRNTGKREIPPAVRIPVVSRCRDLSLLPLVQPTGSRKKGVWTSQSHTPYPRIRDLYFFFPARERLHSLLLLYNRSLQKTTSSVVYFRCTRNRPGLARSDHAVARQLASGSPIRRSRSICDPTVTCLAVWTGDCGRVYRPLLHFFFVLKCHSHHLQSSYLWLLVL